MPYRHIPYFSLIFSLFTQNIEENLVNITIYIYLNIKYN